jgi:NAD(P)H-quinone oxidoreductase subunit 5
VPWNNKFEAFIFSPNETIEEVIKHAEHFSWNEFLIMGGLSVAIAVVGIIVSYLAYMQGKIDVKAIAQKYPKLYQFSLKKWYFDELYDSLFVRGCRRIARQILEIDYRVVDGAVNLTGLVTIISGEGLKYFENGRAQFYALIVFAACLGFVIVFSIT